MVGCGFGERSHPVHTKSLKQVGCSELAVQANPDDSGPRTLPANDDAIAFAGELLRRGQLVAIPTETVYGLAANAWDPIAVERIFAAKNRPATNPLIVHVAGMDRLSDAIAWPVDPWIDRQLEVASEFWPGPLTVVCERGSKIPDVVTAGRSTVAVRVPSHPVARALLQRCPFPIAAPSANPSNYVSPTTAEHVARGFGESVSLILDGGPCEHGLESTIIALGGDGPTLLRHGGITAECLRERFKSIGLSLSENSTNADADSPSLAPGMMKQHYSPRTRLVLLGTEPRGSDGKRVGRIAFRSMVDDEASSYAAVEVLSDDGSLDEVARELFAALRRLDDLNLDEIQCDVCEEVGLGKAIMDRLRRAAE